MSITLGTAMLLTALASLAGTGASAGINAIGNDKKTLSNDEAKKVLEYMHSNPTPATEDSESVWVKSRRKRANAKMSEADRSQQSDILQTDFTDILNNPYWNSLTESEKIGILQEYALGDRTGSLENVNFDQLLSDLNEFYNVPADEPVYTDFVDVDAALADAQSSVDAENERLLASLNEDLQRSGEAYTEARNNILTQQHQRNVQTIDTMATDMSRARRNAIEAGASAGIRIAGNVNALLTAQNKMSQQSLDTSNQLAQMLLNQRNAEAGLRNQWRDAQASTYDRVQGRAQNELQLGQQRYDQAKTEYQDRFDNSISAENPLADRMARFKKNSAYSNSGSGNSY